MKERLLLNENAYFFTRNNPARFSKLAIENIFQEVLSEKKSPVILHNEKCENLRNSTYSILIFKYNENPNFLVECDDNNDYEIKYGYLIIIEYDKYIVLSRKNAAGFSSLRKEVNELDYDIISRLFIDDESLFEKFFMRNMDISDSAIRQRAMEAINLKNSVPILTSAKYILNSMRINTDSNRYSLTFNTSRIQKVGVKRTFDELVTWIDKVIYKLDNFSEIDSYLDYFPVPIDFETKINTIKPISILFFVLELINEIQSGSLDKVEYKKNNNEKINIDIEKFQEYLNSALKYRELEKVPLKDRIYRVLSREKKYNGLSDKDLFVRINTKSITLKSKKLKRVILTRNGKEQNLLEFLNHHNEFIINFDQPDLLYNNRKLFHDTNLIDFTKQFLEVFKVHDDWNEITSEKGKKEEYNDNLSEFPPKSLFKSIVDEYQNSKSLICDDLSSEWADFIVLEDEEIKLIHAKHGNTAMSASNFHEVVAQAQKNLGQFSASITDWVKRKDKWTSNFNLHKSKTKIKRIYGELDFDGIIEKVKELALKPNLQKTVCLYVTFISKEELEKEFESIRESGKSTKIEVIQLMWLISSAVSSCIENNIRIYIHCMK